MTSEAELLRRARGLLVYFSDGCTCVALCKDGPCPRCEVRTLLLDLDNHITRKRQTDARSR